jgi:hypothetical protein
VWPLLAGIGLVPPRAANAASLRQRPGWENGQQLGMVVLELDPGLAKPDRQAADLSLADGLLSAGMRRQFAPG